MKISYAIPVCNEHEELERLLDFLESNLRKEDEVVVQCDKGNTTSEVYKVINSERYSDGFREQFKVVEFPLNGDFSSFKNNLTENCTGDWIFQLDADEYPNEYLFTAIPWMIENNPEVEAFWLARINTVSGITQDHIDKWRWQVNDRDWINFPDYQMRLYKNNPKRIKWTKPVHEQLIGFKKFGHMPGNEDYCIIHHKDIKRQENQNKFYSTL
jgi:glycosyltransferase involved in cell wall biosynthesis